MTDVARIEDFYTRSLALVLTDRGRLERGDEPSSRLSGGTGTGEPASVVAADEDRQLTKLQYKAAPR